MWLLERVYTLVIRPIVVGALVTTLDIIFLPFSILWDIFVDIIYIFTYPLRPVFGLVKQTLRAASWAVNKVCGIAKSAFSCFRRKSVTEKKSDTEDTSILECPVVEDTDDDDLVEDVTNDSDTSVSEDETSEEDTTNDSDTSVSEDEDSEDDTTDDSDTSVSEDEDSEDDTTNDSDTSVSDDEASEDDTTNDSDTSVSDDEVVEEEDTDDDEESNADPEDELDTLVSDETEKITEDNSKEVCSEQKISTVKSKMTYQNIFICVVGTVLLISNAPSAINNTFAAAGVISDNFIHVVNALSHIPIVEKVAPVVTNIVGSAPDFGVFINDSSTLMKMV